MLNNLKQNPLTSIALTTDQGQSLKGNLDLIAAALVAGDASLESWTPKAVILVIFLLVRAFLGWTTRGYIVSKPGMPEPIDDSNLDDELPDLLNRGRNK